MGAGTSPTNEIAKLIGSPPGYLGHRETSPMLTQENLDKSHTEDTKLTFVLFDEIEKASDSLWQLLLGILDKATLTLGDVVHQVGPDSWVHMPARQPHTLEAHTQVVMLLLLLRAGAETA